MSPVFKKGFARSLIIQSMFLVPYQMFDQQLVIYSYKNVRQIFLSSCLVCLHDD